MKREIKFRRPHFEIGTGKFKGFSTWGPTNEGFSGPAFWSGTTTGDDQQMTGLKDKNGKEIYEGDIVKERAQKNKQVIWSEKDASFGVYWETETAKWTQLFSNGAYVQYMEVIGNIYENPELLTK